MTCFGDMVDDDGVLIAICYAGDVQLSSTLVRKELAMAYTPESRDYVTMEKLAREEVRGLWKYIYAKPWLWRKVRE